MPNKKKPHLTGLSEKQKARKQAAHPQNLSAQWRRENSKKGRRAERVAVWLLRVRGYRIIARNMRLSAGEIDIVARRGALLVFVEVKARSHLWLARQAVAPRQWQRIEKAAGQFVGARSSLATCRWRFDVVALAPWRWPLNIKAAWRPKS